MLGASGEPPDDSSDQTRPIGKIEFAAVIDHAEAISPRNIDRIRALEGGIAVPHRMAYQGVLVRGCLRWPAARTQALREGRRAYVHVVRGTSEADGEGVSCGDAVKLTNVPSVTLENASDAEVLVFDRP